MDDFAQQELYDRLRLDVGADEHEIAQAEAAILEHCEDFGLTWNRETGTMTPQGRGDVVRDQATESRDKFLYEQCCKGVKYQSIINKLEKKPRTWERITSIAGVKKAATAYANRHDLRQIPKRQRGRPAK